MVHQEGHHGLGSQEVLRSLQARPGSHLRIQDRELQHQELGQSSRQADHVQQGGQHQVQQRVLRQ